MVFFMSNNTGKLSSHTRRDLYSQFTYAAPVSVMCAVVHLIGQIAKSSVRTDQSGSRGSAEEQTDKAVILFPVGVNIKTDDKFEIAGEVLRVVGIEQRFDVIGRLDHYEVTLERYPS